ncbi:MAG: hypothetical protein IPL34_20430 [Thiofilum sp.]|uniref:hypothetical protein n=1 Tax=Thiofilum sp. TaxID=2212733 RepID=UPI0025E4031B|nr:hypothetical protein [Thiofilum sp.]MBK8455650.1 hypothetical protein [Thiofilum sp.]
MMKTFVMFALFLVGGLVALTAGNFLAPLCKIPGWIGAAILAIIYVPCMVPILKKKLDKWYPQDKL